MQPKYLELEIGVYRVGEAYQGELRFVDATSEAELPAVRGPVELDRDALTELHLDPAAYGEALTRALFADAELGTFYDRVQTASQTADLDLRLRLRVGRNAPELHALRWELLRDPRSGAVFSTSQRTLFSRFMVSADWRPVKLRPKTQLRALVAVSAPTDLARFKLADVDLDGEMQRASASLQGIDVQEAGRDEPLTLNRLLDGLQDGIDILYLVCHGVLHRRSGEPFLFLQKEGGTTERVSGADLATRIAELPSPPRLVVAASCESAGIEEAVDPSGKATAQSSLAPRLAAAGVSAVLAMQGKISMQTVEEALPVFFEELLKDGQIDRALALARGRVRGRPDSWMPALYLRLKSGRIWYVPGFAGDGEDFKKWKSLIGSVQRGNFVPILGPDLGADSFGSRRELAESLAEAHHFPLVPHQRTDFTKVCQFLSIHESRRFLHDEVPARLKTELASRHDDLELAGLDLPSAFKAVVEQRYDDAADPFRILAELGGSLYVSAGVDPMLPMALARSGAEPKALFCKWRKTKDNHPREPEYDGTPDAAEPIVHYAFGFLGSRESLVLTEDDFVDYLIASADYKLIPRVVRGTLVKSSLLFLGFSLDDWTFRVLFRQIMSLEGSAQLADYAHVGVQIDPAESNLEDVRRARQYLEEYFIAGHDAPRIDIYWGSTHDFLNELRRQLTLEAEQPRIADLTEDEDDWISF